MMANIYVNQYTENISLFVAANQVSSSSVDVKCGLLHSEGLLVAGGPTGREMSNQHLVTSEGNTGNGQLHIY